MIVPLAGRVVAAVIGGLLVLTAAGSVVGTIIVPRPAGGWLTKLVDRLTNSAFRLMTARIASYKRMDRVLARLAPAILLAQLAAWLMTFFLGYALLLWPFVRGGITTAFTTAGPALWEIGSSDVSGAAQRTILDFASLTGIITVTLQIAYLPTLYSAFNRRETEVALLNARAGVPSWGPELLARTHYALGSGASTIDTLPDLYAQWERFAADIAESHTTYLPLVRFRSPRPLSSWVIALLSVLDSAALYLALSPGRAPAVPARLCLRSGFTCFTEVAREISLRVPESADPDTGIALSYDDFLVAVERLREVDFPIERDPAEAWPDFVGWRVNYEQAAYAVAAAVDAVPAMWSGPRRRAFPVIPPIRPAPGRPPKELHKLAPGRGSRRRTAGRRTAAATPGSDASEHAAGADNEKR
ncbi:MAG TPA: hypothetical protein VLX31_14460 [Streptosporangiaceae bacterium]|nr:hypothetical protein [Streptosporangiaceae bacterium]